MSAIDSRQRRWLLGTATAGACAVALYVWLRRDTPEGLTGGSRVGLAYGIVGGLLILHAWLLSALRYVPSWWWLGARALWLRSHVYLGTLSFVLILCHSGGRVGGPFEQALYAVFALVVLTGFLGLWLQSFLPRRLTEQVPCEVPYEQLPAVCGRMQAQADELVDKLTAADLLPATRSQLERWYAELVRPYLGYPSRGGELLDNAARAADVFARVRELPGDSEAVAKALVQIEMLCSERRRLAEQERLQRLLHGWLYLHVPLQAALLVLLLTHVALTLHY